MVLKTSEKDLTIKYGFEATLKTKLLSRMAKKEKSKEDGMEYTEELLLFLPEVLLVGLQKYHSDEYGFDYESGDGKEEQIVKMFTLIEDYFDNNEDADAISLYNALSNEMLKNGFLKNQFQMELQK